MAMINGLKEELRNEKDSRSMLYRESQNQAPGEEGYTILSVAPFS
jgi:hypothetical protein